MILYMAAAACVILYAQGVIKQHTLDRRVGDIYYRQVYEELLGGAVTRAKAQASSPEPSPPPQKLLPFLDINQDFVAMLNIPGSNISTPVVWTGDNKKYLNLSFEGKKSARGTVFLGCGNNGRFSDKNNVLYGHNMKDGTMFGGLMRYKKPGYHKDAPVIEIDSIYGKTSWLIFAAYTCEQDHKYFHTKFQDGEFKALINEIQERSVFTTDIDVGEHDIILTLSTCDGIGNARFAVHAVRV